jgi:hypothetical protein
MKAKNKKFGINILFKNLATERTEFSEILRGFFSVLSVNFVAKHVYKIQIDQFATLRVK